MAAFRFNGNLIARGGNRLLLFGNSGNGLKCHIKKNVINDLTKKSLKIEQESCFIFVITTSITNHYVKTEFEYV